MSASLANVIGYYRKLRTVSINPLGVLIICLGLVALQAGPQGFSDLASSWGFTRSVRYGSTESTRYLVETTGTGAAIFDFNGDGRNDVLILNGPGEIPLLYQNEGEGSFREIAKEAGLPAIGWAQSVCTGDIDNDGDEDLFLTAYGVNRLLRNTSGRFSDITANVGLPAGGTRWGAGCAMLDFDHDGRLDLFAANYVDITLEKSPAPGSMPECKWKGLDVACGPRGLPAARNVLYRQTPDGRFEDVSARAGILKPGGRYGLGVAVADFDNDGWPDIYVACDQTPSLLYHNLKNGTFQERAAEAGVAYDNDGRVQAGMGVAVADFDGNGFLDIAKTNFSGDLPSLYVNEDGSFFHDSAELAGLGKYKLLGWGVAFFDYDADSWPDLLIVNGHVYPEVDRAKAGETHRQPSLLFRNGGKGKFIDQSADPVLAILRASRGLALGDLDGDGRPEAVIVNLNAPPTVLRAPATAGNWLRVELRGTKSNRSAIGARVTVEAAGRRQIAERSSGGSYYSQHEGALYFGLGTARKVDRVIVRWPNGGIQTLTGVAVNETLRVEETAR
ncbi:MAG: CRTAC1 family protein [Acidobacteria bacterium]|nr:CRTAC1 family protein [Acidobacteriota bacterium]